MFKVKRKKYQDFHHRPRRFNNPFVRKKKPKGRWLKRLALFGIVLSFFGLIVFLSSSIFEIKEIKISGNELIGTPAIQELIDKQLGKRRLLIFSQKNILFFNKSGLAKQLDRLSLLGTASINKDLWHTLSVVVSEKNNLVALRTKSGRYYLDETGKVLEPVNAQESIVAGNEQTTIIRPQNQASRFPEVIDDTKETVSNGEQALERSVVDFITQLDYQIRSRADFVALRYVLAPAEIKELSLFVDQGWEARFKIDDNPKVQIDLLLLTLKEKIGDRSKLHYIDLRYGDKIFYR